MPVRRKADNLIVNARALGWLVILFFSIVKIALPEDMINDGTTVSAPSNKDSHHLTLDQSHFYYIGWADISPTYRECL